MTIVLLDEGLHKLQFVKIKGPQYLWSTIKWNAVEQDTLVKVWKIVTDEKKLSQSKGTWWLNVMWYPGRHTGIENNVSKNRKIGTNYEL